MQYTTTRIEKWLEENRRSRQWVIAKEGVRASAVEWLGELLAEGEAGRLADEYIGLAHCYADEGAFFLAVDRDVREAKRRYYLAALASRLVYELVGAGFPHRLREGAGPYSFKRSNLGFTKNAILANAPELALATAGEDTVEGMLVRGEDGLARRSLPQDPEKVGDDLRLALWGVAHEDEKRLAQGLRERIGVLRRQGAHALTVVDGLGLAVLRLARQRGMACGVEVFELPWQLLDDAPADTAGLALPYEQEVRGLILKKTSGGLS